MTRDASALFTPLSWGVVELSNRIAMAPLTRNRAQKGTDAAGELQARYYAQRADAGLIIAEATQISKQGQGYVWTPGIYTSAQVEGWKKVTSAVHEAGGRIVLQLWHVGRISHTSLQPGHGAPVAPSAIRADTKTFIESGFTPVSEPRELALDELPGIIGDFKAAALSAKEAGFDGVEIHAANGYLLDQFQKDASNRRDDSYGGSIENRIRLTLDVTRAVLEVWDAARVGIRISPVSPANGISDSNPQPLFEALVQELDKLRLGYLHVIEGATGGPRDIAPFDYAALRQAFSAIYIANNGYTRDMAIDALSSGRADMVAFGRPFIANPDLVERLRHNWPLNEIDPDTLYGGSEAGYTDYPLHEPKAA